MAEVSFIQRVEQRVRGLPGFAPTRVLERPATVDGMESSARSAAERLLQVPVARVAGSSTSRTVVLFALDEESRPFLRATRERTDLDVRTSGMGRRNAEAAMARILSDGRPEHIITAGVAGGLRSDLAVGDVVFESSDSGVVRRLTALGAKQVKFASTEHVLVTAADRRRLREQTGADVVENESGFVQAICRQRGLACTTIRTISDTADQDMPFDFNALTGADGNVDYGKVMAAVAREPWKLPAVIRLWRHTSTATSNLSELLQRALPER